MNTLNCMRFSQHKGSLHGLESQIDTDSDGENCFLFHGNGKSTQRGKDARMFTVWHTNVRSYATLQVMQHEVKQIVAQQNYRTWLCDVSCCVRCNMTSNALEDIAQLTTTTYSNATVDSCRAHHTVWRFTSYLHLSTDVLQVYIETQKYGQKRCRSSRMSLGYNRLLCNHAWQVCYLPVGAKRLRLQWFLSLAPNRRQTSHAARTVAKSHPYWARQR